MQSRLIHHIEIDLFRKTQNHQMDAIDFHNPEWVEKMWICEKDSYFRQQIGWGRKGDSKVESIEMHPMNSLSDLADSTLEVLPGNEGIDVPSMKQDSLEYVLSFLSCL